MDGGAGFYDRVKADTALKAAVGTKSSGYARVEGGWPEDLTAEGTFPLVTFFVPGDTRIRPGIRRFRIQVDMWAWVDGASGGPGKLDAIDEALLALLDEQAWSDGTVRWQGLALPASDRPGPPGTALRKRRDFDLLGSTL